MEAQCRYCHAEVTYDTLVCPKCGSRLVEMEESRKWGPIILAGVGVIAIAVSVYLFATWSTEVANTTPPPSKPTKDTTAVQIAKDDERNRAAVDEANRKWRESQEKQVAAKAELDAWQKMDDTQRSAYLQQQMKALSSEVDRLKRLQQPKLLEGLAALQPHLDSTAAFLKAGSLDVAFESIKAIREQVADLEKPLPENPAVGSPEGATPK